MKYGSLTGDIADYPEGIILPVDKPYRWTSADVIRKLKYAACRHFGKKNLKVGHAGTLDPLATGILLICIGNATKKAEELQKSPKQYLAGISFGATTPSYDLEKEIDRDYPADAVTEDAIQALLPSFTGVQEQVAPLFSAKSVDGVRAYEMARRLYRESAVTGKEFDHSQASLLQTNLIEIYGLELVEYHPLSLSLAEAPSDDGRIHVAATKGHHLVSTTIRVDCSKGTYIRALARDLGEAAGSGAFLHSLRRTRNGGFGIEDSYTLEEALRLFSKD